MAIAILRWEESEKKGQRKFGERLGCALATRFSQWNAVDCIVSRSGALTVCSKLTRFEQKCGGRADNGFRRQKLERAT